MLVRLVKALGKPYYFEQGGGPAGAERCLAVSSEIDHPHAMSQHRAAAVADVPLGTGKELVIEGRIVALYNVDGEFHAIDGVCPHAGGPLGQGMLRKNIVTCPWHGWQFDVTTGRHCLTSHIRAAKYEVTVRGDEILIELP